jgi:hypothetical protein
MFLRDFLGLWYLGRHVFSLASGDGLQHVLSAVTSRSWYEDICCLVSTYLLS